MGRRGSGTIEGNRLPYDRTFSGRWPGSSWGIFDSRGNLKPDLVDLFEQPDPGTRQQRDIFLNGQLSTYYDIGVDTSEERRDWLSEAEDGLEMAYPAQQEWGAVFFTVGVPVDPPRPWKDFSEFGSLVVDLKGAVGGETVRVGVKDYDDPDDGQEKTVTVSGLSTEWKTSSFPLTEFASSRFVAPGGLERVYVPVEFVFDGPAAMTVYVRSVRYVPPGYE